MELISRYDIDGSFEIEDSLRAIGVSTTNLVPNSDGIIPLSNQSALILENKTENQTETESLDSLESLDFGESEPENVIPTSNSESASDGPIAEEDIEISLPPSEPVDTPSPDVIPAGLFIDSAPEPQEEENQDENLEDLSSGSNDNYVEEETNENVNEEIPSLSNDNKVESNVGSSINSDEILKYVNKLVTEYEKKQKKDLEEFKNGLNKTLNKLLNNDNQELSSNLNKSDEILSSIPSLDDSSFENILDPTMPAPELEDIPNIDSEPIKPKFVL